MRFGPRFRDFFYTLRFRLVLWITLVVFVMVFVTNFAVNEVEHRMLRYEYDEFLAARHKEVQQTVADFDRKKSLSPTAEQRKTNDERLILALTKKVGQFEHRAWFLQLYDQNKELWHSANAPALGVPAFSGETNGPFDDNKHRILEQKLTEPSGEVYFVRSGFLQSTLQEDIDLLNRIIMWTSFSILLAAPLGGYVIALRATRPITQIIAATAHMQPSNISERLPIRGTGDEIDQLSQTINGMLDRLASYINHNRDFVANAAHELRSPLAAMRSSVEVALNRNRTPEEYATLLTDVMEEISRLVGLVNRLLILAEGDGGRLAGKDHVTRLDKIVRESVDMFDAVAESMDVRLTVGELAPAVVHGDETYLRQVVRNLIDNAIKYNKHPGSVHVRLCVDPSGKYALFMVEDSGIGIDREVLPRIFERFYRADRSRSREKELGGYGLGLSICQTIAQALGGDIRVESETGRGSIFTVRLPLALADPGVKGPDAPARSLERVGLD